MKNIFTFLVSILLLGSTSLLFGQANTQLINQGAKINITSGAVLYAACDIINDNMGLNIGDFNNNGEVFFMGDTVYNHGNFNSLPQSYFKLEGGTQNILGTQSLNFGRLTINGTNNKNIFIQTYILDSLIFNSNKLLINNSNLVLTPNAHIKNADNSKYVVTNGIGSLIKESLPSFADFLFPIGDAVTSYNPVIIHPNSVDTFAARVINGVYPSDPATVNKTFIIKENNPMTTTAELSLGWSTVSHNINFDQSQALIWQQQGALWLSLNNDPPGAVSNLPATDLMYKATGVQFYAAVQDSFIVKSGMATPPVISLQPIPITLCEGDTGSFVLSATGIGTLTYQWQINCSGSWSNISNGGANPLYVGATDSLITLYQVPFSLNGCQVRCVIGSAAGNTISDVVTLTVNQSPLVSFAGLAGPYCRYLATVVPLTGTPAGGTFSGYGIQGTNFMPFYAGTGLNYITYSYTNGLGCTGTQTQTVQINALPLLSMSGINNPYCDSDNTPALITGIPAGGSFTGNGMSGNNFTPAIAGIGYHQISYIYQDVNGCIDTISQYAHVAASSPLAILNLDTGYCINNLAVTINGFPTGGTFSGPGISGNIFDPSIAGVGVHNIQYDYVNAYGCTSNVVKQTEVFNLPLLSISGLQANYCQNDPPVLLTGVPAGGTFSGIGVSGNHFYPSVAGIGNVSITYTLSATNNCISSISQSVDVDPSPIITSSDSLAICSGQNTNYNITSSFPSANYSWTSSLVIGNATGFGTGSGTSINDIIINNNTSYSIVRYTITPQITGPNPCAGSQFELLVYVGVNPTLNPGSNAQFCSNSPYLIHDALTDLSNTVLWSHNGLGAFNDPNLMNPIYIPDVTESGIITMYMTVTNIYGCSATDSIDLTIDLAPVAFAGGNQAVNCGGAGVTLGAPAQPNNTYNWLPINFLDNPNIAQPIATPSTSTSYILTVTSSLNGCISKDTVDVILSGLPIANAGADISINCLDSTIIGTPTQPGYTYNWFPTTNLSDPNIAQPMANPLGTTSYILTVYDNATGCFNTDTMTVTILGAPIADAGPDQSVICGGNTGVVIGSAPQGGLAYNWSPSAGLNNPNIAQPIANPLTNTTYTLTVTDLATGCYATDQVVITATGAPIADAGLDQSINCGGPGTIIGTPGIFGLTYNWLPSNGLSDPNIPQPIATPLTNTTYQLIVIDMSTGCFGTDAVNITVIGAPYANAGPNQSILCGGIGTTIGTTALPGMAYNWSPANGLNNPNTAQPTATPLGTTIYTVTVTDLVTGCYSTDNVTITVLGAPYANAGLNQSISCGGPGTTIGTPATTGLVYNWFPSLGLNNPNIAQPLANPQTNTTYTVIVTDPVTGCYATDAITITVIDAPIANAGPNQSIACGGNATIGTSSISGLSYHWAPAYALSATNIAQPTASPMGNTTYYVTVTNLATGCYGVDSVSITVIGAPIANAGVNHSINCGGPGVQIGTIAQPGLSYAWNPTYALSDANIAQPIATPLGNTTYYLTVTDAAGCFGIDNVVITVLGTPIADAGYNQSIPCGGPGTQIGTPGTAGGLMYAWLPTSDLDDATIPMPFALPYSTTNYVLTVTETATGCFATDNMVLTVVGVPNVNAGPNLTVCANDTIMLTSASSSNALVHWTHTGNGNLTNNTTIAPTYHPIASEFGNISMTITAVCNADTASDSMILTIYPYPIASFSELDSSYCMNTPGDMLIGYPSGGVFSGNGLVGNFFDPVVAGIGTHNITYSYTDNNGCIKDTTKITIVNDVPNVSLTGLSAHSCVYDSQWLTGTPAGGTFSGMGMSGNIFDPMNAGIGTFNIVYTYQDMNGCINSDTQQTHITPLVNVVFSGLDPVYCLNSAEDTLIPFPLGGIFAGPGMVGDIFNPGTANVGFHTINYLYQDSFGCQSSYSQTVIVQNLPIVYFGGLDSTYCIDTPPITLNGFPLGGTFSGAGITNSIFDPILAGPGIHTITYSYVDSNSCMNQYIRNVEIFPLPVVTLNPFNDICIDAPTQALSGGLPLGGTYSGNGISYNSLNPALAGAGTHTITYAYTDSNGCVNYDTQTITINPLPIVSFTGLAPLYCASTDTIPLVGTPSGGTFTGSGIYNNSFIPNLAGAGFHTITYTYTDTNTCTSFESQIVQVKPLPHVDFHQLLIEYCVDAPPVSLYGFPLGGTFSGNGISGNTFDPALAGIGNHIITYTYTDTSQCSNSINKNTTIHALPSVTLAAFADVCLNTPAHLLSGGLPLGGTYSGNGISANMFNASIAGIGNHLITYTYTDTNSCTNFATEDIFVNTLPVVSFSGLNSHYCVNDLAIPLTGSPLGGTFSGNGMYGNLFMPDSAGIGFHTISYAYMDTNGCTDTFALTTEIKPLPQLTITGLDTSYCINSSAVNVYGSPAGGYFSGPGINGIIFDPVAAGIGIHQIVYTYTDFFGCTNNDTLVVVVNDLAVLTILPIAPVCIDETPFLLQNVFPAGGSYSGNGVSNGMFYPQVAGVGQHNIYYDYIDNNNCLVKISFVIVVNPLPVVELTLPLYEVCSNDALVTLTGGTPLGGTYSGNGVANGIFDPFAAGAGLHIITYTYLDSNACVNFGNSFINVNQAPIADAGEDITICANTVAVITAKGGDIYLWSTNETTPEIYVSPLITTTYTVTVYDASNACSDVDEIVVNVIPLPEVQLVADVENDIYSYGQYVTFTAIPGTYDYYDFYINNYLKQSSILNTYTTNVVTEDSAVTVIAFDGECISLPFTLSIDVQPIFNVLTPNGDGKNDVFLKNHDLTIVNRWGQLLYEGFDGWDGTYNNKEVAPGTYFYVIRFIDSNENQIINKGSVTLIRE